MIRTLLAVVVLAAGLAVGAPAPPPSAAAAATGAAPGAAAPAPRAAVCPPTPFTAGFDAALRARWPGNRFTAAVYDRRTGCSYDYRPDLRITTASVLKAEIMAGILLRAQAQGRGLTQWEQANIGPMMARSADPEANALWSSLGGIAGMEGVDRAFGLTQTRQASPWGITSTSARDRTSLMRQLLYGDGGPLTASYRSIARSYLLSVVPSQRWGISAGVPSGTRVPLKNGFFSSQCCRWRLNSSGAVEIGAGYVVTILSDLWPNEAAGIAGNEFVARAVNARLAGPFTPFPSPAAFVDRQYADVLGRAPTFAELSGTTASVGFSTGRAPGVVGSLLSSSAFTGPAHPLLRLYVGGLGRYPTGERWAYRMWQLRTGRTSLRALGEEVARDPIYGGPSVGNAAFVERVIRQVMTWEPDAGSVAYWSGRLDRGEVTRGAVVRAYVESNENRWWSQWRVAIGSVYLTMLGRPPGAADVDRWQRLFAEGATTTTLIGEVYRSTEYRNRVT
ncbi:MAG TPA: DUF4214 domain-containing protein [Iamia sp.]|nr:DUF4214 domain-containing protein [Iamia sp.]